MYNPLPNCAFLHSCYISPQTNDKHRDAIVTCVKDMETGESKLQILRNPSFQVYVLHKGMQTFTDKREYVRMSDCDTYVIPYKDRYMELARLLGRRGLLEEWKCRKIVEESPYAFGWNISPQVRQKCEYLDAMPKDPTNLRIAILDIETCVLPENPDGVLALSICDWPTRTVHCFIDNAIWLREQDTSKLDERAKAEYKSFAEGLNDKARRIWDAHPVQSHYYLCNGERELLERAFQKVQELKPDFMGVWNIGFDVPRIMDRMAYRQLDVNRLFTHPDVPDDLRIVTWHEDKKKVDHFTDTWHVLDAPGYTYWYDAMNLYSRLRKVQGRDVNYTLDYIGNKIIGAGKMHFGANQSHFLMQQNDKVGYCVYNTIDTIIPALMDAITQDVSSMLALSDCSLIQDFSMQTVQLTAQFYKYLKEQGKIIGASAGSLKKQDDIVIGNIGGAVLNPTLMRDRGLRILEESPRQTSVFKLAADLDVSSFYPSMTIAANVSRETKKLTILHMEGCPYSMDEIKEAKDPKALAKENAEYINNFMGLIPCPDENAVYICSKYFGLPDYREMLKLITEEGKES